MGWRCAGPRDDVLKAKSCYAMNDKYQPSLRRDEASTAKRKWHAQLCLGSICFCRPIGEVIALLSKIKHAKDS